jgi:hypothetical protein
MSRPLSRAAIAIFIILVAVTCAAIGFDYGERTYDDAVITGWNLHRAAVNRAVMKGRIKIIRLDAEEAEAAACPRTATMFVPTNRQDSAY